MKTYRINPLRHRDDQAATEVIEAVQRRYPALVTGQTRPMPAVSDETRPFSAAEIDAARAPKFTPAPDPAPSAAAPSGRAPIGEQLIAEMPGIYGTLPCGFCGARRDGEAARFADPDEGGGLLLRLRGEAIEAGWKSDVNGTWSCPSCQQQDGWHEREAGVTLAVYSAGEWDLWLDHAERVGAAPVPRPANLNRAVDYRGHQYAEHAGYDARIDALRSRMALRVRRGMSRETARSVAMHARLTDIDGLFDVAQANVRSGRHARGSDGRGAAS